MFRAGASNPYDDIVAQTTDENLTSEDWQKILELCDKVQDEGEAGARNVVAAVLKRLAHRNPNVQLYTLTLAESLSKNCNIEVHREIASRAFTQGLERLITDRMTHEKVRRRALNLVAMWTHDFEKDTTLGIMEECYESLKSKGYKFEAPDEPPPPEVDDEVRRREEEELQRVLEMSVLDKGGRDQWGAYNAASSSGAGGSGSLITHGAGSSTTSLPQQQQPTYGGYVPAASPAVSAAAPAVTVIQSSTPSTQSSSSPTSTKDSTPVVTRVRALHTFEPTEPGELAFEKGDIIKVVDRGYKDWWRGQLKGRTGIFPVNYVQPLPEPTAAEIAREVEQEAAVFSQAANVDRLLTLLRQMDPSKDNLADNDEVQELYRSCMTLRPKIVKLIDKYSQKRADLVSMNESFVKARTIFDRMMEESLAKHSTMYQEARPSYASPPSQPYMARPDSVAAGAPQGYGWSPAPYEQPGYNGYAGHSGPYPVGPEAPYPAATPVPTQPYGPDAYGQRPGYSQTQSYGPASGQHPGPSSYVSPAEAQLYPGPQSPQPQHTQPQAAGYSQPYQQLPLQPHLQAQPQQQVQPQALPQVYPQVQPQTQIQFQPQAQIQPQVQPQPLPQAQPQPQPQAQTQQQAQHEARAQSPSQQRNKGPPYVFDGEATYEDPNVQAWAQYYAQGGTDPTGSVYFLSVPGVKEGPIVEPASVSQQPAPASQQQPAQQSTPDLGQSSTQQPQGHGDTVGAFSADAAATSSPTAAQPPVGYGASPYGAANPGAVTQNVTSPDSMDPSGQQQHWQSQTYSLPNQFAGLEVSGETPPNGQPAAQGVGTPA